MRVNTWDDRPLTEWGNEFLDNSSENWDILLNRISMLLNYEQAIVNSGLTSEASRISRDTEGVDRCFVAAGLGRLFLPFVFYGRRVLRASPCTFRCL